MYQPIRGLSPVEKLSAKLKTRLGFATYEAVRTRRVVHPDPVGTVMGQPVLAPIFIVTSGAAHGG